MRHRFWLSLLLLPLLAGGCATSTLWNKSELDAWNQPAADAKLQLFDASRQKDFLVVYDEYSERHDVARTRAYFLDQNEKRVAQGQKPHFVSAKLSRELPPVPVLKTLPLSDVNSSPAFYAVISTNSQSFAIYSGAQGTNHNLPVYNDGWGQRDRIALTPVTVAADLTIVGGVLGCIFVYGMAESGYSTPAH